MKKNILKLLGVSGVIIAGAFTLIYAFQSTSEKVLANEFSAIDFTQKDGDQTLAKDFYEGQLDYAPEVLETWAQTFQLNLDTLTVGEITQEQSIYLYQLDLLINNAKRPILTKNEERVDGKIVLDSDGNYAYSLQTQLMDVMAMSDNEAATKIITDICQKHQVDPNGIVENLTIDIIREMDDALFEASDHPKN